MQNILKNNQKKAFTLTELAIVIIIISVFISAIINASVGASNNAKITVTKNRMEEIYKALGNYAVANGRLPCPAPITDIKGSDDYGNSRTNGLGECFNIQTDLAVVSGVYGSVNASQLVYGMIPVQNLKLSSEMAEDGFGTKFSYVIDKRFTGFNRNSNNISFEDTPNEAESVITINEVLGSDAVKFTDDAAFVIVSHGANKKGGFNASSAAQNERSSDANEQNNDLGTTASSDFNSTFISSSDKSDVFDDIVFFKTKNNIMTDFDLMSLETCPQINGGVVTSSPPTLDVYVNVSTGDIAGWASAKSGQVVNATSPCDRSDSNYNKTVVYPTKKCGPFGVWQAGAIDSCQ